MVLQTLRKKIYTTFGPFFLITVCPPAAVLIWYTNAHLEGSFMNLVDLMLYKGIFYTIYSIWSPVFWGSETAWIILGIFALTQLLMMRLIPGKPFYGPITPKGNVPVYKANGIQCYALTVFLFLLTSVGLEWYSPTLIYDQLGFIIGALCIFSLFFCLALYFKGRFFPSTTDTSYTKNFLFDYYWGTELYPRFFGFDIKQFTNCRFGMMSWTLLLLSYAFKQHELYGISSSMMVCVGLQIIYVTKFFIWETGYFRSLDIMHDRAGYYICWGCLVWVPAVYTSPAMYLVHHPIELSALASTLIFLAGSGCILMNYLADRQRQQFRALEGNCLIWGKKPKMTVASYKTASLDEKHSLLLASGWWGLARHFHYIPEIFGAFFWSLPALFFNFMPYFYVVFLTTILIERAFRDDRRCRNKYGTYWEKHCELVPYRFIPYIF